LRKLFEAATLDGRDVRGYFVWSLIDNLSWNLGFHVRYGLALVDYEHDQTRYIKDSGLWYSEFIKTGDLNSSFLRTGYDESIMMKHSDYFVS